jgi:hypothetical protein
VSNIATLKLYLYGMRLRGFSPGCQPMEGYIDKLSDEVVKMTRYHDILLYNRELTWGEVRAYELNLIVTGEMGGEEWQRSSAPV